jgi:hypothetical protein
MALIQVTYGSTNILVAAGYSLEVISMENQHLTTRAILYPYQQTEVESPLELLGNDGNGTDAGHVRIYEYSGGSWTTAWSRYRWRSSG